MAKRFTDTTKWTQNKWFRKLPQAYKLFWLYLLDSCDAVGVWEEDVELASMIIGHQYNIGELLSIFKEQIHVFRDGKKWWIIDFCNFQYGELREDSGCKPHLYYIGLLKRHTLWIPYTDCIQRFKEKDIDKEKEKDQEQDPLPWS